MLFNTDMFIVGSAGINTGNIVVQLVVFIILLVLLRKFAWGPIMEMMKTREDHVASEIDSAERSNEESKKLVEEQRALLKEARVEAQQLIELAKKQGEDQKDSIIAVAKQEATNLKDSAVKEIQAEKDRAVVALQQQVASLSVLIASKVIEKELKEEDQTQLIAKYLKEAGDAR